MPIPTLPPRALTSSCPPLEKLSETKVSGVCLAGWSLRSLSSRCSFLPPNAPGDAI
jgi:hypothetical protein